MTITEVVTAVNETYPNTLSMNRKIAWLRRLDRQITEEVVERHETDGDYETPDFDSYDADTELVVPDNFAELYIAYLNMKIAEALLEGDRYSMAETMYNNNYISYQAWYNRHHMPLQYDTPLYRS